VIAEATSAALFAIATAIVSIVDTELVVPVIVARPGYRMAHNINAWPGHIEGWHVVAVVVVVVVVALIVGLVSGVLLATSVAVEVVIEAGRGKCSVTLCITQHSKTLCATILALPAHGMPAPRTCKYACPYCV